MAGTDAGSGGASAGGSGTGGAANGTCGNGTQDGAEECDDGNATNGDGCDTTCRFSCTPGPIGDALCGDGNPCNGRETCEADHRCKSATDVADGTSCGDDSECRSGVCERLAVCGDGVLVAPEECDPPDGAGCGADCRFGCIGGAGGRECAVVDPCSGTVTCDAATHACISGADLADGTACGAAGSGNVCEGGHCTGIYCGNGTVDQGEECDDANAINGDGCDSCRFSCVPNDPSRDCSTGNPCQNAGTCDGETHECSRATTKAAGTACGTGKNCLQGNCIPVVCGDGVVALGAEACDDGNLKNGDGCDDDCSVSCSDPAQDCANPGACRTATCSGNVCSTVANAAKDGAACSTGGGSATCHAGACTAGTCGNSVVEAGEECDTGGANGPNAGCETTCTFSCTTNGDCDDGDPCNGVEACETVANGRRCSVGTTKADGTKCGTGKICLRGGCRVTECGDRFTDSTAGEQCDPPNTVGCDAGCKALTTCDLSGVWGVKVTIRVTWGDGQALNILTDDLVLWERMDLTESGVAVTGSDRVCGLQIPDFSSALTPEWYGLSFGTTAFDGTKTSSISGTATNRSPGAHLDLGNSAVLAGLTMTDPRGSWPSRDDILAGTGATAADDDADGTPGITSSVKTGTRPGSTDTYAYPLVDVTTTPYGRAASFSLVLRGVLAHSMTVDSCTSMSGTADVSALDDHVLGCMRTDSAVCSWDDANLADNVKPTYTIGAATFTATKLAKTATCADIRTALP